MNIRSHAPVWFCCSSLHGDGFQVVIIGGAFLHRLFKPEAVVRLVPKIEVVRVVLRGINNDHALLGERNVDVKHSNRKTDDERRPRNVVQHGHRG